MFHNRPHRQPRPPCQASPGASCRTPALALFFLLWTLVACAQAPPQPDMWQLALGHPDLGSQKIEAYGCAACHTIPGIPNANALVGPPLDGWSQRSYIAGLLPNEPDNLVAWLMDPPAIDEDTAMPDMGIDRADARDIAAYLYTLGEGLPDTGDPLSAQPVAFSHQTHAGELELDCRYCHTSVTESAFAGMPGTHICMTCHSQVLNDVPMLAPVRLSWQYGAPLPWVRVHDLHDSVHFHHAAHVNAGVGCETCHGRVAEMRVIEQAVNMTMSWCLDCHRDPQPYLQESEVPSKLLTDCSLCHY